MPAPHDARRARIRVSTTRQGTFATIGYVRSAEVQPGSEGESTLRWLGGEAVRPGELTLGGTVPYWWDDGDTEGQEIIRAAYWAGTPVWLQACPRGTEAGAKAFQFEAVITEVPFSFDSEAEAVEGSFSYRGNPSTWEEITLA